MKMPNDTAADPMTRLMLETFRLNGRLLAAGDRLVGPLGLTSARWQVLGAVALAEAPQPVAQIARRMGLARQSVQRIADDLAKAGLLHYAENPDHRRAKLVDLTAAGRAAYDQAMARHHPWAQGLAAGIDPAAIEAAAGLLREIGERLEARRAEPDTS